MMEQIEIFVFSTETVENAMVTVMNSEMFRLADDDNISHIRFACVRVV